jgi:hypothetical protein
MAGTKDPLPADTTNCFCSSGLRLSTLKQYEHSRLHGLGHRSVIPYVHEEDYCIVVCVVQARG